MPDCVMEEQQEPPCTAMVPGFRKLRLKVPRPALSLGPVQCIAVPAQLQLPPSAPGNQSLGMGETGRDGQFEEH